MSIFDPFEEMIYVDLEIKVILYFLLIAFLFSNIYISVEDIGIFL